MGVSPKALGRAAQGAPPVNCLGLEMAASNDTANDFGTVLQEIRRKVRLALCHLHRAVAKKRLNLVEADSFVDEQAGKGVSQIMNAQIFEACFITRHKP